MVKTSAAEIRETVGKGYNGFKQMLIPSEIKWLKDYAKICPVYSF
jgi:hypothetical protein